MLLTDNPDNGPLSSSKSSPSTSIDGIKTRINLKSDKPGNTLLISELTKTISDNELMSIFKSHNTVTQIFQSKTGVILVEFSNSSSTSDLVFNSKITPFKIGSHVVRLSFSSQTIDEFKSLLSPNASRIGNTKVLHFLISNLAYSINVSVLHKICSPHGKIVRIYIGKKNVQDNSIEALVEFASESDAKSVKDNLDGNDIYSSCCSLTLSYSKIHKLFVEKNDTESFDYTIVPKAGLLGPPPVTTPTTVYTVDNTAPPYMPLSFSMPPIFTPPIYHAPYPLTPTYPVYNATTMPNNDRKPANNNFCYYKYDPTTQETVEGVVIQCRNFSSKIKADNFFNLFCLYGNVEKVKLANENASVAYIQMSNREGAEFCREMLSGLSIFKKTLEISATKLTQLTDSVPNNDPVHCYYSDVNNRFKASFQGKSRVFTPSQTLHFFNVPSTFRAEEIADVFVSAKVKDPSQVVIFPRKGGSHARSSLVTGLIEFDGVEEALEGVLMVNHTRLLLPQVSHPYHIKLAFSPSRISEQHIKSTAPAAGCQDDQDRKRAGEGEPDAGESKGARTA